MLNIEKYKDELKTELKKAKNDEEVRSCINKFVLDRHKELYFVDHLDIVDWLCDEYTDPTLTFDERSFIGQICAPIADRIDYVMLYKSFTDEIFILISYDHKDTGRPLENKGICFETLKHGLELRGMELDKKYSLKELGILKGRTCKRYYDEKK